ncbi:MAG TPA: polysaccharide deacetylase family protein [Candidatus Limnocylindria bacterium]|nr:polysaccharide deacetylase family protein [Candidatus Limnocylindria bacterium]
MRARSVVFGFHDLVPADRLDAVPRGHRPYAVDPRDFRAYLVALQRAGKRVVPVEQLPSEMGGGAVSLTFDDGWESDYTEAFRVLRELKMRATFFVVPTLVETPGHLTWAQLREMLAAGMEIGSHSLTHPFMHDLDAAGLRYEFGESKRLIEDRLRQPVRSASLPRGWEPPEFETVLCELGYRVFCTSRVGWWYPGGRPLAMPRVIVRRGLTVDEFAAIADAHPRSLWRLQLVEQLKGIAKRWLGPRGWNRLRAPLLALRERV